MHVCPPTRYIYTYRNSTWFSLEELHPPENVGKSVSVFLAPLKSPQTSGMGNLISPRAASEIWRAVDLGLSLPIHLVLLDGSVTLVVSQNRHMADSVIPVLLVPPPTTHHS